MVDPSKKARDSDRDGAIEVVEAAYADGQITQADSVLRVERLLQARTLGDIDMLVRDLQRPGVPKLAPRAPQPPVATKPDSAKRLKIGIGVVVAVFAVFTAVSLVVPLVVLSSVDSATETDSFEFGESLDLTSARGYRALADAVEENTGSRMVFRATIYPGYAVVDVPVDEQSQRSMSYYYDGSWQEWTGSSSVDAERFDLDRIDGTVVVALLRKVGRMVEQPDATYLLVNARGGEEDVCLSAYATNDRVETAYLDAACDGTVVNRYRS